MKIFINRDHLAVWKRLAMMWGIYLVVCLLGALPITPRLDEFVFVSTLPLWLVVLPYGVFCLVVAIWKASRFSVSNGLHLFTQRRNGSKRRLPK